MHVLIFAIYSSLIFVIVQQSGMPSALHKLWEIAFNFVNHISRILIGIIELDDNRAYILVTFHTGFGGTIFNTTR